MAEDMAMPKLLDKRYQMGAIDWRIDDTVTFVRWKDQRMVYFLSTIRPLKDATGHWDRVARHRAPGPVQLSCPLSVVQYIKYMRGVDRGDQLISLYNTGKRTKKWWKRIICNCLEAAVLIAHI